MESDRLKDLDRRLRKLEDVEEIRNLRMSYHHLINEGQFDRFPTLFTHDALVDFGFVGKARGEAEIAQLFLSIPRSLDLVKQFIHNHMVDVQGDDASGISYLDARFAKDGESFIVAAKLDETYRRLPAGWKISQILLTMYFSVPISRGWAGPDLHHVKPFRVDHK